VVFCDNSLNRIELKQIKRQYPSTGTTIEETDMVRLAESMACDGAATDNAAELTRILAAPQSPDKPLLIAARIDPMQYASQF
jgi:acetolactate synthase-1/2/3 large subunit